MERSRQRREKRAKEWLKLGVWSARGRRRRDPGNRWAPAAAEGEGQGWERPWAGGPGSRGRRRRPRDRMPGSSRRPPPPPRAASRGAGLGSPTPALRPVPGRSALGAPRLPTPRKPPAPAGASAPAGTPPHCLAAEAPPLPQPSGASRLPPHLPGVSGRTQAAQLLSGPWHGPRGGAELTPGPLGLSASQGCKLRALRPQEPEPEVSWKVGRRGPNVFPLHGGCWEPES